MATSVVERRFPHITQTIINPLLEFVQTQLLPTNVRLRVKLHEKNARHYASERKHASFGRDTQNLYSSEMYERELADQIRREHR